MGVIMGNEYKSSKIAQQKAFKRAQGTRKKTNEKRNKEREEAKRKRLEKMLLKFFFRRQQMQQKKIEKSKRKTQILYKVLLCDRGRSDYKNVPTYLTTLLATT
uniref:Uncharacterized protein n=1 Tax=Cacopsylla melanoneura TaxID=428564 RepID=A0A8D9B7C7_9HEMI